METKTKAENKRQAQVRTFTEGKILLPLVRFALPVLAALFLQAMYGAVDLLIVGQFTEVSSVSAHVSAVSTGSQIMLTLTNLVASFAMGATILLGQQIGRGEARKGGETIGACIVLFACIGIVFTILWRLSCMPPGKLSTSQRFMCGSVEAVCLSSSPIT